jgi:hypothetical protein
MNYFNTLHQKSNYISIIINFINNLFLQETKNFITIQIILFLGLIFPYTDKNLQYLKIILNVYFPFNYIQNFPIISQFFSWKLLKTFLILIQAHQNNLKIKLLLHFFYFPISVKLNLFYFKTTYHFLHLNIFFSFINKLTCHFFKVYLK